MTAHDHTEPIRGCFRCELAADEAEAHVADQLAQLDQILEVVELVYEDVQAGGTLDADDPNLNELFHRAGVIRGPGDLHG